jgi:ribosome-binding protein aMBF1 (putative translation factor)
MAAVVHKPLVKGATGVDIDHNGPAKCTDCGQDAYIRLAGAEVYVCAHCFADRGRTARAANQLARASQSPPTRSVGDAAR